MDVEWFLEEGGVFEVDSVLKVSSDGIDDGSCDARRRQYLVLTSDGIVVTPYGAGLWYEDEDIEFDFLGGVGAEREFRPGYVNRVFLITVWVTVVIVDDQCCCRNLLCFNGLYTLCGDGAHHVDIGLSVH